MPDKHKTSDKTKMQAYDFINVFKIQKSNNAKHVKHATETCNKCKT